MAVKDHIPLTSLKFNTFSSTILQLQRYVYIFQFNLFQFIYLNVDAWTTHRDLSAEVSCHQDKSFDEQPQCSVAFADSYTTLTIITLCSL